MKATSEELAIFVSVVESGSFSRAAEQLGQANSAVSRAVKKLEMKLGVSLLNRTTRQLSLTEEGERYFRRVQSILQEMAAAESELWRRVIHRVDCYGSMPHSSGAALSDAVN
ncbi:LysR family transcriptional regulator [Escherichia coli]|nr:LysR family transcriptional regulator [Escherichia coli]